MNDQQQLEHEIKSITQTISGTVGIYALHLESGFSFEQNVEQRFNMASTYKIPIAVHCLLCVKEGKLSLDSQIEILPEDLIPGSGIIIKRFNIPGVSLSVKNLIRLMLEVSDNTATDLILKLTGGPKAVNDRMKNLDIKDLRVDTSCLQGLAEHEGIWDLLQQEPYTLSAYERLENSIDPILKEKAKLQLLKDERDTCTPRAMGELLNQIKTFELLGPEASFFLLESMQSCCTGMNRIRALLPKNILVAQKTGTIGDITNDVGIITLPENFGYLILAVFVKGSNDPLEVREMMIAQVAKRLFDFIVSIASKS